MSSLMSGKWTLVNIEANGWLKKTKLQLFSNYLKMIIEKKLRRLIISLVYLRLVVNSLIGVSKEIEVTNTAFVQVTKMVKLLLLASMLLKLKNKINNSKNNRTLAKSNAIIVKRQVTILSNISTKSQKTSFSLSNLFFNDSG